MSKETLSPNEVKEMLIAISDKIIESEELLSEADRRLGDGDHGLGMKRGFTAAKTQLETLEPTTVGQVFSTTGITLMSTMGGASGAVMGILYQNGGTALGDANSLDAAGLSKTSNPAKPCFVAGVDIAFNHRILYVSQTQIEPQIQTDRALDYGR